MFTSSHRTYQRITPRILAHRQYWSSLWCAVQEKLDGKKVSRHFEMVPPLGYRAYSLSTPKRRRPVMSGMMSSKSGHGLEHQQGVWPKSGLETNSLSSAWQKPRVQTSPTPDRCQPVLTWMTSRIAPKTALQTDESHQKLLFFWSEKTSRSSPWHYFLYLSFFPCDSTCNLLEAFPRHVSRMVYLSDLKLTTPGTELEKHEVFFWDVSPFHVNGAVWKSDELWQDTVNLSDLTAASCFTAEKRARSLVLLEEVWWK